MKEVKEFLVYKLQLDGGFRMELSREKHGTTYIVFCSVYKNGVELFTASSTQESVIRILSRVEGFIKL